MKGVILIMFNKKVFFKVQDYEEILFDEEFSLEEQKLVRNAYGNDIDFERLDFNNETFESFKDYIEFKEYEEVYFISNVESSRLKRIKNYLEGTVKYNVVYFPEIKYVDRLESDFLKMYEFSFKSLITGAYPEKMKSGNIKHIYVFGQNDINLLNSTVVDSCFLNSVLIFNTNLVEKEKNLPLIYEIYEKYKNTNIDDIYELEVEEIEKYLYFFINTGKSDLKSSNILDIYPLLNKFKLNRLIIENNQIFLDIRRTTKLGNIDSRITDIKNNYSIHSKPLKKEYSNRLIDIFFLSIEINNLYKKEYVFVTAYNSYKYLPTDTDNEFSKWIGFCENKDKYFLYNMLEKRLFDVDATFFEIFEILLKNISEEENEIDINLINNGREILLNA